MERLSLFSVVYVDAAHKDRTEYVCAKDILKATDMAVRIIGVSATNIRQIQKCKAEPYVELKEE